jgi:hypothetical protein
MQGQPGVLKHREGARIGLFREPLVEAGLEEVWWAKRPGTTKGLAVNTVRYNQVM